MRRKLLLILMIAASCKDHGRTADAGTADLAMPMPDLAPFFTTHDPASCDEAKSLKSYVGCDYWPTINFNPVWSVFDFAVVISNPGQSAANITITGGALTTPRTAMVMPNGIFKIGLPWVNEIKGGDSDSQGHPPPVTASVLKTKGAYHLVSDVPVLVYQFNPLEYRSARSGKDLQGVDWSTCGGGPGCFSVSNDASLLLPSTAMTGNYVATGVHGDDILFQGSVTPVGGSSLEITAVADATHLKVKLGSKAQSQASMDGMVSAGGASDTLNFDLNAGDVLELVGGLGSQIDFSGSIIQGSNPVQVISGHPCTTNPQVNMADNTGMAMYTCDHVEEVQLPFETWGKKYVVTAPTGPKGDVPGHTVRIYGGIKDATLVYSPQVAGAPSMIAANSVVEFDTKVDFVVLGSQEFAVGSLQLSGQKADPNDTLQLGDPALSFMSAIEQYRDRYLFLSPSDYTVSYADVVVPTGTTLTLDDNPVTDMPSDIGNGYGVLRIKLDNTHTGGAHNITGTMPFGIQVIGYGQYTSYQYPGGLDLKVLNTGIPIN